MVRHRDPKYTRTGNEIKSHFSVWRRESVTFQRYISLNTDLPVKYVNELVSS